MSRLGTALLSVCFVALGSPSSIAATASAPTSYQNIVIVNMSDNGRDWHLDTDGDGLGDKWVKDRTDNKGYHEAMYDEYVFEIFDTDIEVNDKCEITSLSQTP